MARTYCGNDANFPGLAAGTHVIGTNYQCMQKGIGTGRDLPYDANFAVVYAPIDGRRFYCGNAAVPPVGGGYFAMGSPSKCLQIGVGVGKAQRAGRGAPWGMNLFRYYFPYILFFLVIGVVFYVLYFAKLKVMTKKDRRGKTVINWELFIPYYVVFCIVVGIFIRWFWKKFVRRWI